MVSILLKQSANQPVEVRSATFEIAYRLPLGQTLSTWSSTDFDSFVRKYSLLTISKIKILSITIHYEDSSNDQTN